VIKSKGYSIIVVPADHSGTRQYRLSSALLWTGAGLLALVVFTFLGFVVTYGSVLNEARRARQLRTENTELRAQVATLKQLNEELEELSALRAQIVALLGGDLLNDPIDPSSPAMDPSSSMDRGVHDLAHLRHVFADEARRPLAPRTWPVPGEVVREFQPLPEGQREAHPGLSLESDWNAPIRAAGRGQVVDLGYDPERQGYLILDHGFGFRTVYAHADRLVVQDGQTIDRGQIIAYLPERPPTQEVGGSQRPLPRLYFELWVDGQPVDPRSSLTPR
jgi:murein DD-endopeptidase MepM/ murein hydrolase activator NlpD